MEQEQETFISKLRRSFDILFDRSEQHQTRYQQLRIIKHIWHVCKFTKPVYSKYRSFNNREIIFQCKCGNKKAESIFKPFDQSFPIDIADNLSNEDFDTVLNSTKIL